MKDQAYQFACQLMTPGHRNQISEQYKRKIETIVRKPQNKEAAIKEDSSPCPFCATPLVDSLLDCTNCRNIIPYCAVTGMHMVTNDCSHCPHCNFPAKYSHLIELAKSEAAECPMCGEALKAQEIQTVNDPAAFLAKYKVQAT